MDRSEIERKRVERIAAFEAALHGFKRTFEGMAQGHPVSIKADAHKDLGNVYFTLHATP